MVRELSRLFSNHRAAGSLDDYLAEHGVIGIEGIDTRALVRLTRQQGAMKGSSRRPTSTMPPRRQGQGEPRPGRPRPGARGDARGRHRVGAGALSHLDRRRRDGIAKPVSRGRRPHVVALDFGMKWNIPRHLVDRGCRVTVVPGTASAEAILEHAPDGIFLSNGPGDPVARRRRPRPSGP